MENNNYYSSLLEHLEYRIIKNDDIENEQVYQDEIRELIRDQYVYFNNLGINYLNNNYVKNDTLMEMLEYVNNNIVPIVNYEYLIENEKSTNYIGRFIYSFIVIDLIDKLLPGICRLKEFSTCRDLLLIDNADVYSGLNIVINNLYKKYETLQHKFKDAKNKYLEFTYKDIVKFTFYSDFISNDFQSLFDSLIYFIIEKYEVEINAKI
jgi:hypothetical protein